MTNKYIKPRGEFAATVLSLSIPAGGAWFDLNDFELGCLKYDSAFELLDKEPPKPVPPKIELTGLACAVPVKDEPKKDEPVKDQPKAEPAKADAAKTAPAKPAPAPAAAPAAKK